MNIPGASDIVNVSIYTSSGENITSGVNIELTAIDDITITSLDDLINIVVKATYTI